MFVRAANQFSPLFKERTTRLCRKKWKYYKKTIKVCTGIFLVIYEQRERVFHRDIQTRENYSNTRAKSASVFVHYFRVFGYPGGTRARVVHMASQMNRHVTGCFGLLI